MNAYAGQGDRPAKKDKNQNIQVFVRLRPLNARERDLKSIGIVEVNGNKEIIVRQPALDNKLSKKFVFDKAFGPYSKQVDVYHEVVSPLIEEVLAGYNCTVFAYGQTGTGKTHTMVGESSSEGDVPWQNDPMAGIIPRALSQLFDELRIMNSEYTVRVSYLELYNEELFDLLSSSEDNSKLRIYEDVTRKGSNIVNGLEELTVYNKNEVYKIMAKGQEKRRTASTLMNAQSSRSHTVFTITVHMKENSIEGEELMKIGKLNLVDLAGSENISKAGTDNPSRKERARECVNINQSLLTLGRVITALVERHPHIPYRESKLTRILQESLGGRTKTSIIATISPGHKDLEETLSTLEYANRARNIQNKPEINQKLTKVAVLKEYSEEIDRLKRDLQASRERNGVYLAAESYACMTLKLEEQEKEIQDKILYIKQLIEDKERINTLFNDMTNNFKETENRLNETNQTLNETKVLLVDKKKELIQAKNEIDEHKHIVGIQVETEKKLTQQAKSLLEVADATTNDVDLLHNALDKKRALESKNLNVTKAFSSKSQSQRGHLKEYMNSFIDSNIESVSMLHETLGSHLNAYVSNQTTCKKIINEMFSKIGETILLNNSVKQQHIDSAHNQTKSSFDKLKDLGESECTEINRKLESLALMLVKLDEGRERDRQAMENMNEFVEQWKNTSFAKMLNLRSMQKEWSTEINTHMINVSEQYNSNESYNEQETKKISDLRKQQDDEINAELKSLKDMIVAIEEKRLRHNAELNALDNSHFECLKVNKETFANLMKTGSENISVKMDDVNRIVNMFDESNKTFTKDMTAQIENYRQRVSEGCCLDKEIKDSVEDIAGHSKKTWLKHFDDIGVTMGVVNNNYTRIISEQCDTYNGFLAQCHAKSDEIIQPIESTIEKMLEQKSYQDEECTHIDNSMKHFRDDMSGVLHDYDDIESKFLNEEYKLYSPSGKTPNRREYCYPQQLVATSPHERILMRYRKMRRENIKNLSINGTMSPNQVISLNSTMEATPLKVKFETSQSDVENASPSVASTMDDSVIFTEPKSVKNTSVQNNSLSKCSSESDIFILNSSKTSKENLNQISSDKKEMVSKLRPPTAKKILGTKNYC